MVKGVIFAGGYGKRLRPITDRIPKTLIEIKRDYTILDNLLLSYKYIGIDEVFLLVGYKHSMITKRYGENWQGLKIKYLIEEKPLGTLWALRNCSKYLNDDALVRNGDTVSDFNLMEMIRKAESSNYSIIIALTNMKTSEGIVRTENDKIIDFIEKPKLDIKVNAGIYYVKKDAFKYLNENYKDKEIERTFIPKMVNLGLAGAYFEDVKYFPVNNFKDLEEIRDEYRGREDKKFGYVKKIGSTREYYIKKGYAVKIYAKGTLNLIRGKGKIGNMVLEEGFKLKVSERIIFQADENSLIILEG